MTAKPLWSCLMCAPAGLHGGLEHETHAHMHKNYTLSFVADYVFVWQCFSGYMLKGGKCVGDCGDGVISNGETCDDGNKVSGDGCNSTCHIECGWECTIDESTQERVCQTQCGDGVMADGPETCDDGNTEDGDGTCTSFVCLCFLLGMKYGCVCE
jgi:cysteine-rich repeat protein